MIRVMRACVLLEIINDDGSLSGQGIELNGPGVEGDVSSDVHYTLDSRTGEQLDMYGFYDVALRGKGRMFIVDLDGGWPTDTTSEQENNISG